MFNTLQFQCVSWYIVNEKFPTNRFYEPKNTRVRLGKANLPTVEPYRRWNVRLAKSNVVTDTVQVASQSEKCVMVNNNWYSASCQSQ